MFILLGLLMGLAVAELTARLLGPPFGPSSTRAAKEVECDRLLGWRGISSASTVIDMEGYRHKVALNSRGMHDTEHRIEKKEGVFRIMMLGDSFVEAFQVAEHQTSHQVLEDILNSSAPPDIKFEVISAGVGGWGSGQELMYFLSEGRLYAPDLVLGLWFSSNDLQDDLPGHGRITIRGINCFAPYFAVCDGQFDPEPWFSAPGIPPTWQECSISKKILSSLLNRLYYSSRLYQRLEPILTKSTQRIKYSPWHLPWLEKGREDEILSYSYQVAAGTYFYLADEANQLGAKTALVIVPAKQAIHYEVYPQYRTTVQLDDPALQNSNPKLPNQVFTELMETKGLPVLDLHPYFVDRLHNGVEALHWDLDGHWNVVGNRTAAETIAAWLIDQGLVPVK